MAAASHSSRMPDLSASLNDSHSCAPLSDLWNLPQSAVFPMHDSDLSSPQHPQQRSVSNSRLSSPSSSSLEEEFEVDFKPPLASPGHSPPGSVSRNVHPSASAGHPSSSSSAAHVGIPAHVLNSGSRSGSAPPNNVSAEAYTGSPGQVASTSSLWARSPPASQPVSSPFIQSGRGGGFRPQPSSVSTSTSASVGASSTASSSNHRGIWAPRDEVAYPPRQLPPAASNPGLDRPASAGHWLSPVQQSGFKAPPIGQSLGIHQTQQYPLGQHSLPTTQLNPAHAHAHAHAHPHVHGHAHGHTMHGLSGLNSSVHAVGLGGTGMSNPTGVPPSAGIAIPGNMAMKNGPAMSIPMNGMVNVPRAMQPSSQQQPSQQQQSQQQQQQPQQQQQHPNGQMVHQHVQQHVHGSVPHGVPHAVPHAVQHAVPHSAHAAHPVPHQAMPFSHVGNGSPVGSPAHSLRAPKKSGRPSTNTELYKTELCASYTSTGGNCPYGEKCQFAHGMQELKTVDRPPKWRSKPCQNWIRTGSCSYNERCCFRHDSTPNSS